MAAPGSPTDTLPGITRTVSFNYLRALFDYADRQGLTTGHLLAASGIDPDADRDGRLDVAACHAVFEQAARLLGDEDVGLRAGLRMRLGHYGAAAYAALSCRWGMEAIHYLSRYQALVMDVGAPDCWRTGTCYWCIGIPTTPGVVTVTWPITTWPGCSPASVRSWGRTCAF